MFVFRPNLHLGIQEEYYDTLIIAAVEIKFNVLVSVEAVDCGKAVLFIGITRRI